MRCVDKTISFLDSARPGAAKQRSISKQDTTYGLGSGKGCVNLAHNFLLPI